MSHAEKPTAAGLARPGATYRLQFSADFRFADARRIVPYLSSLGVTHVYASPLLAARSGSTHGYDIVDHGRLNPELGEPEEFEVLVRALHDRGMGLILDFVPNHMGVGVDNPWWLDVLEWGAASPYASYFDIDWKPLEPSLSGKLLLPVLPDHYGSVLERGELSLEVDEGRGRFSVRYAESHYPVAPRSYPTILLSAASHSAGAAGRLETLAQGFEETLRSMRKRKDRNRGRAEVERMKHDLAHTLGADENATAAVVSALRELNGEGPGGRGYDALHRILERQFYRLAYWRVAAHEINYRRFFDINDLAGLRMEEPDLFEESHQLLGRMVSDGKVQGLRLDHVDGLRDPAAYLRRLRGLGGGVSYVLVEKILAAHEHLRRDWEADGTTGYEFMAAANRLQVDPSGERELTRAYERFLGRSVQFEEVLLEAKRQIMRDTLASELNVLANSFNRLAKQNRTSRDYTLTGLRHALSDVIAHFPVYRAYVTEQSTAPEDRRDIAWAVTRAKRAARQPDTTIYDFIRDVLTLDLLSSGSPGYRRTDVVDAAMRFQQYTGPVMAKSMEDTAFYRYLRLVSLNEVGGEPGHFGLSPSAFHEDNRRRLEAHPHSMLTTATHDHKRGEDVRARLAVLSEVPRDWNRRVRRWTRMNRGARRMEGGERLPDRHAEYLFYQTVVGAWPLRLDPSPGPALEDFRDRIDAYLVKATREAKLRTSWAAPDKEYEAALSSFVHHVLDPEHSAEFLQDLRSFVDELSPAGAVNGIAQNLLKLTAPGVPDLYQGTEFWDFTLVDPDNRRPVAYGERSDCIDDLPRSRESWEDLLGSWKDGRIKQRLVQRLLHFRRAHPSLFGAQGAYLPLDTRGKHADRIVAYARSHDGHTLLVVAPRLVHLLLPGDTPLLPKGWSDTALVLPEGLRGIYHDVFTGDRLDASDEGTLPIARILSRLPASVLVIRASEDAPGP